MIDESRRLRLMIQWDRRQRLLAQVPPDRKEAAVCLDRIDDILDGARHPVGVSPDGEIVFDDQSPWVTSQLEIPIPYFDDDKDHS